MLLPSLPSPPLPSAPTLPSELPSPPLAPPSPPLMLNGIGSRLDKDWLGHIQEMPA